MARQPFRFGRILKHKRQQEEILEEALALDERTLHEARLVATRLQGHIDDLEQHVRTMNSGEICLDRLLQATRFLSHLREELTEQKCVIEQLTVKRDETRFRLNEATKERKLFEKLQDKAIRKMRLEERRIEQRVMDELAQRRRMTTVQSTYRHEGGRQA